MRVQCTAWKKYREEGIRAIKPVKKQPCQVGLAGYLWDRKRVSEMIKRKFGIELPLSTTGDYLAKWNFTSQRTKKHYKQNKDEVNEWGVIKTI